MILARLLEVFDLPGFQCESVLGLEERRTLGLPVQKPLLFLLAQTVSVAELLDLSTCVQDQRMPEGIPEANVGEKRPIELDVKGHVVKRNPPRAVWLGHLGRQDTDREPETSEKPGKGGVELVAESASAIGHDLSQDSLLVHKNRYASMNVEVLERDRKEVTLMYPSKQISVGFAEAFDVEPAQVALNIHRDSMSGGHHTERRGRMSSRLRGFRRRDFGSLE